MPIAKPQQSAAPSRLPALDQLRGYAIAGMVFVNFLGDFDVMPWTFKHHPAGMSYADTIAPLFMFVVGMGFRLSFRRRIEAQGIRRARIGALKRYLGLTLLGIIFYGPAGYKDGWWDALVDIGLAGVLAVPFMERGTKTLVAAAAAYMAIFQFAYSQMGYGEWTMSHSIDGGPLGPLSWVFNLLFGAIAYDLMATRNSAKITKGALAWGIGLALLGWSLKIPWPGIKPEWPFSQKGMSAPYPIYATGLCFLTFLVFHHLCPERDGRRCITIPTLTILGENALVMYLVQNIIIPGFEPLFPSRSSAPKALLGFVCVYACCFAVAWKLHKNRIIIKL